MHGQSIQGRITGLRGRRPQRALHHRLHSVKLMNIQANSCFYFA